MKKCSIIFIIAIISIIPTFSVNASFDVTLNNGTDLSLPDLPFNKNEYNYVVARDISVAKGKVNQIFAYPKKYSSKLYFRLDYNYQITFKPKICVSSLEEGMTYETYSMYIEENSWTSHTTHEISSQSCYELGTSSTIVYSTDDLRYYGQNSSYFPEFQLDIMNFDTKDFKSGDIVFHKPKLNLFTLEYEKMYDKYYNITLIANEFNPNYKYQIKFDYQNSWTDITSILSNDNYHDTVLRNGTLIMVVLDEGNNILETKTFLFNDIVYDEDLEPPTADIDVSYINGNNNLLKAKVTFTINNSQPFYYYKYSFNDTEDINIDFEEIIDNKYSFETYQNTMLYFYIYNLDGEVIYRTTKTIDGILDNGIYYYYDFNMSDFYNSSNNSTNTLVFFFENGESLINNEKLQPYVNIYLTGKDNEKLPFYISYSTDIIDVNTYSRNVNFNNSISQYLPFEKLFDNVISYNHKSYTAFSIAPNFDLTNNTFEDYNDYKLVIRTTKKMSDNYFKFIGGVKLPDPLINNDLEEGYKEAKSIFDMFLNPIKNKFPIFWQLTDVFKSLNYDNGDGSLPPVLIDFSFLGINKKLNAIDFSFFLEYRPYLFGILKTILSFLVLRNIIKNFKPGGAS